jgi:hypothetical protein
VLHCCCFDDWRGQTQVGKALPFGKCGFTKTPLEAI